MKTTNPKMKIQARRVMPKMRARTVEAPARPELTVGDLVAAAFDTLADSRDVARVLGSMRMSKRVGRRIVFV